MTTASRHKSQLDAISQLNSVTASRRRQQVQKKVALKKKETDKEKLKKIIQKHKTMNNGKQSEKVEEESKEVSSGEEDSELSEIDELEKAEMEFLELEGLQNDDTISLRETKLLKKFDRLKAKEMKLIEEIEAEISSSDDEQNKTMIEQVFGPSDGTKAVQLDHINTMQKKIKKLERQIKNIGN